MHTQTRLLLLHPDTDDQPTRPDVDVASTAPTRRGLRLFSVITAALVAVGGYVHYCLYRHGYRAIPKIGVGFLLQVLTSAIVVVALLVGSHRLAAMTHLSDRSAAIITALAAAGLAIGTLVAFGLTRTPKGLFGFQERGLQPAPKALIALVSELGVLVSLAGWAIAAHAASRGPRRVIANRV